MQTSSPRLSESRAAELHQHNTASAKRAIAFVTIYALSAVGAVSLAASLESAWKYLACLPLYLLSAASLHGISLFTHEGVHGALSKNVHWNRWLSMVCALPVLQNFSAYRVLHLKHHRHLGDEGDPDHYKNYSRWTWVVFAMHWGRLLIGYPAYLIMIPILGFRQGTRSERHWILLEIGLLIATVALLVWVAPPFRVVLHAWLLPMLLINTMVNIRGMSQHTLLEHETDPVKGTRTICTHPIVAYFMCNENYHLEHHLYPGVPWYHLPEVHRDLKPDLEADGAPIISSYFEFVRDFIHGSIARSPIGTVHRRAEARAGTAQDD